jgi:thiamine biosynthesis lipoprotein
MPSRSRTSSHATRLARRAALGAALLALAALANAATAPAKKDKSNSTPRSERVVVARGREMFGVTCTIVADGADSAHVGRAVDVGLDAAEKLSLALDLGSPASELSRLNAAPAQTRVDLSPELFGVLEQAIALAEETDGMFDPTIEPLRRAWGASADGRAPAPELLNEARTKTGWRRVKLEAGSNTAWLQREGMAIELDDIGRGAALDRVESALREAGVGRALASFGASTLAISDRDGWTVKIPHPGDLSRTAASLAVRTCAVSTSGNDGSSAAVAGPRFLGALDPVRGVPVSDTASVTVVTRAGARAAALAIALLAMGRDAALQYAGTHPDVGVLWLEPDGASVRAWKSNLPPVTAESGVRLDWMN